MSIAALPGFREFYPADLARRSHLIQVWKDVARRYAFVEYDGPPLESLELYTRKSGGEIVAQLYTFEDKGGRQVALRPEMTPTLARMVAAKANSLRKPVRWFAIPQLFRYERQQRGRLREHFQFNVDIVGESDVSADAELLAVAIDVMRALGLSPDDVVARVSDRRVLQAYLASLGVPADQLDSAYTVIDKLDRQPEDVSAARLAAIDVPEKSVQSVLDLTRTGLPEVVARLGGRTGGEHARDLERYMEYLRALLGPDADKWVRFDLSIVRGLAYYTGIVFELFDARGELRALCGGGRYDNLLASIGGVDLPALGFGMGDVVLGELLKERGLAEVPVPGPDLWVAPEDGNALGAAMSAARALRERGLGVEYPLRAQSTGKQGRAAHSAGAAATLFVQPDFPAGRAIRWKHGQQTGSPREAYLSSILASLPESATFDELLAAIDAAAARNR